MNLLELFIYSWYITQELVSVAPRSKA